MPMNKNYRPEEFQVQITFGPFKNRKYAEDFKRYMLSTEEQTIASSIEIKGSFSK